MQHMFCIFIVLIDISNNDYGCRYGSKRLVKYVYCDG